MSPQKLILSQKCSLSKIISSCEETRKSSKFTKMRLPHLPHSLTCPSDHDSDHLSQRPKPTLKERASRIRSIDFERDLDSQQLDLRRVKIEPFCSGIPVSKQTRPVFKQVLRKYKRHFHPSNASRGQSNTSDDPFMKTPRRIREMRDRYNTEDNQNEIRRLVVLNQVINENNRREVRLRRQKSYSRQLHFK